MINLHLNTNCNSRFLIQVSNRRCNYLTGLHITVRQKDPAKRSVASTSMESFNERVKTRHHESRGSSRTSSRASSPISDNYHNGQHHHHHHSNGGNTKLLRSTKSRATKVKRPVSYSPQSSSNSTNKVINTTTNQSKTSSAPTATTTTAAAVNSNSSDSQRPLEPCVTYTMVDGVPHFKVYFPTSKEETSATADPTTVNKSNSTPRASIVESDVESCPTTNGHSAPPVICTKVKSTTNKPAKRPRIIQSTATPSLGIKAQTMTSSTPSGGVGTCIEKCGSWMGSPHFKTHRTLPSVNSTVASSVAGYWSPPSPIVTTMMKPATTTPAPKLTSPITTAKATPNNAKPLPSMPKLTMGNNQALKLQQQHQQPNPLSVPPPPPPIIHQVQQTNGGKFVPIAPKLSSSTTTTGVAGVPNIVIVPYTDKNSQSAAAALSNNNQPDKRSSISLLKTYPQLSISTGVSSTSSSSSSPSGGYLTVRTLKEQHPAAVAATTAANHDEVKRKIVKLFPSAGNIKETKEEGSHQQQQLTPPTVIVADMSM